MRHCARKARHGTEVAPCESLSLPKSDAAAELVTNQRELFFEPESVCVSNSVPVKVSFCLHRIITVSLSVGRPAQYGLPGRVAAAVAAAAAASAAASASAAVDHYCARTGPRTLQGIRIRQSGNISAGVATSRAHLSSAVQLSASDTASGRAGAKCMLLGASFRSNCAPAK